VISLVLTDCHHYVVLECYSDPKAEGQAACPLLRLLIILLVYTYFLFREVWGFRDTRLQFQPLLLHLQLRPYPIHKLW
jgi:hypothetical protein